MKKQVVKGWTYPCAIVETDSCINCRGKESGIKIISLLKNKYDMDVICNCEKEHKPIKVKVTIEPAEEL